MKTIRYTGKELFRVLGKNESNFERLEKELDVDIDVNEFGEIKIDGTNYLNEYLCEKIMEALSMGFKIDDAIKLKDEEIAFKKIILKHIVKSSRVKPIKGRIIGTGGKSKRVIEELTDTIIVIEEHAVGILGYSENVEIAANAVDMIIHGAPHGIVYKYLEKYRSRIQENQLKLSDIIKEEILHPELAKAKKVIKKVKKKTSKKKTISKKKPIKKK